MTPTAFADTLTSLSISQRRLGRLLGVDKNTTNRWATGACAIPQPVALLLRIWVEHPDMMPADAADTTEKADHA